MMYNYSFIIPHRNSPDLLQRCLNSIPISDDVQVIVVDDNSEENIVDFSNFPGLMRKNTICIFDKEGKGAGHARNIALTRATGKWLVFADADDFFAPSFADIMEKYRDDNETDMVFFNYCKMKANDVIIPMPITRYIENYYKRRMFSESVLRYSAWSPWSRMVKRMLPVNHNILFEELPFSNDMMFVLKTTALATRIKVERQVSYYYYSPSSGTQTSVTFHDPKHKMLRLEGALKRWRFYKDVGFRFMYPIWLIEKNLGIKADPELMKQYDFNPSDNFLDTLYYLFSKAFRIL